MYVIFGIYQDTGLMAPSSRCHRSYKPSQEGGLSGRRRGADCIHCDTCRSRIQAISNPPQVSEADNYSYTRPD